MSQARKKRGFRSITVDESNYRWKLIPGISESFVKVTGAEQKYPALMIHLPDWKDPWLNLSGFYQEEASLILHTSAYNEPQIITPAFVRDAILYAISKGWDICSTTVKPIQIRYAQGNFSIETG